MHESLLSPYWYRIAGLHPRLRSHVSVRMQRTRGQAWYVLHNQATGRHHRVNAQAFELVGRLDGRSTVDEIWQGLLERQGDAAPTQNDVIRIMGQLTDAGLVQAEVTPDVRTMLSTDQGRRQRERRARLNPLSFRLGLFNPATLLEWVYPRLQWLLTARALALWCMLTMLALVGVVANWPDVRRYASAHFMTPAFMAMVWLMYPLMKAVHELGHALMLRRFGCEVPEVGVSFLLFVPMPYVDASAANRLTSRLERGLISAAGIMVELAMAAIGLGIWLVVEDGVLRELAFVLMTLGGLSTLMFNGNPLMKFDGYFVACDAFDLPNLAQRSARVNETMWAQLFQRLLRRMPHDPPLADADLLERWALRLYAPLSWLYRLAVGGLLVSWASGRSSWLGVGILLWMGWSLVLQPCRRLFDRVSQLPDFERVRARATGALAVTGLAVLAALAWVPMPASVLVDGVVWLPADAEVRASTDGEVEALLVRSGQLVLADQPLIRLRDPALATQRAVLRAQIEGSQTQMHAAYGVDSLKASNAQQALARDQAQMAQLDADLARQVVRARQAGQFVMARQDDLDQRQVSRGQLLAYVLSDAPTVVRAVVSQRDIDDVRSRLRGATVMLAEQPGVTWPARPTGQTPAALERLPAPALADKAGGPVATDPADADGLRPGEPLFALDVVLSERIPRAGGLARVKLELAPRPLLQSWGLRVRQLLLRHFSDLGGARG